jgi:hypothetical protein
VAAYVANKLIGYNYMFLMSGEGTPYDIFYNLLNGNKILYPLTIPILFMLYASIYYIVYALIMKRKQNDK